MQPLNKKMRVKTTEDKDYLKVEAQNTKREEHRKVEDDTQS